jgi:hypothetical protein
MALTIAKNTNMRNDIDLTLMNRRDLKFVPLTLAFDSSYATGGEDFSFDGVSTIVTMIIEDSVLYSFIYDYTNDKILAYVKTTGAEVANLTDLSGQTGIHALLLGY